MSPEKLKRRYTELYQRAPQIIVLVLVVAVGVVLMLTSHAATPTTSLEAENGSASCPAARVFDNSASGTEGVKFGAGCGSGGTQTTNCVAPPSGGTDFAATETAALNNTTSHLCGFPDTTNSGVPANIELYTVTDTTTIPTTAQSCTPTYDGKTLPCDNWGWTFSNGSITINSANAVVDGIKLTGGGVNAATSSPAIDNATIKNSDISAANQNGAIIYFRYGNNNIVEDSTVHGIDDSSNSTEYAIQNVNEASLSVDHDFLYNCTECVGAGTGLTVTNSYLVANASIAGSHYEDIYFAGGAVTIKGDTLINIQEQTANVDTDPTISGLDIENSLLASGTYPIYGGGSSASGVVVKNNHFSQLYQSYLAPSAYMPSGATWCGNTNDQTGAYIDENGDPGAACSD